MKKRFCLLLVVLIIDRLLKVLVTVSRPMYLADGLLLGPVYNSNIPGTFGLIAGAGLVVIVPVGYLATILGLARLIERGIVRASAGTLLILATGLVSNAIDFLIYPGVVDPIGVRLFGPVFIGFNVADALILYGTLAVVLSIDYSRAVMAFRPAARASKVGSHP
jgi:lipoprotein signal peptidase